MGKKTTTKKKQSIALTVYTHLRIWESSIIHYTVCLQTHGKQIITQLMK